MHNPYSLRRFNGDGLGSADLTLAEGSIALLPNVPNLLGAFLGYYVGGSKHHAAGLLGGYAAGSLVTFIAIRSAINVAREAARKARETQQAQTITK